MRTLEKKIIETTAINYALEKTGNRSISVKVVIETIKTKKKNARRGQHLSLIYTEPQAHY